jgi:hypothetical protein
LNGNGGTTPGTHFFGTTDLQALELKVNNWRAVRLEPTGFGDSPNLIGGYSGNIVSNSVVGATVGGGGLFGSINSVEKSYGVVGGGIGNTARGDSYATVSGGSGNTANGFATAVGGGQGNTANGNSATIAGGGFNAVTDDGGTVGGGFYNSATNYATVSGGFTNSANGLYATVGGGQRNLANANFAVIGGGLQNTIQANASGSTIAGGNDNLIESGFTDATISGGFRNDVRGTLSVIGGGFSNATQSAYATVPGGYANLAAAQYSFAAGRRAKASHLGAFVWADSTDLDFASTAANQFSVRANGGARFETAGAGMTLDGQPVLSGTVTASQISDGAGSGLDADLLDGLNSTDFATAAHNHFGQAWNGSGTTGLQVENTASSGTGLYGWHSAGGGTNAGILGETSSTASSAAGVLGRVIPTLPGGFSVGVRGINEGTGASGIGVHGSQNGSGWGVYGTTPSGRGVYGYATGTTNVNYGVYGESNSTNGFGVYAIGQIPSGVAIKAAGTGTIQSTASSYIFVPGTSLVRNLNTDTTRWDIQANGAARVWRGATAGNKGLYLPVTLPAVLYGQPVTVENVTIYFVCENGANNFISQTIVRKQFDVLTASNLAVDVTDRTSNVASSYTLNLGAGNTLSSTQGILIVEFLINFLNDTEYVQIGGVRIQLSHQ